MNKKNRFFWSSFINNRQRKSTICIVCAGMRFFFFIFLTRFPFHKHFLIDCLLFLSPSSPDFFHIYIQFFQSRMSRVIFMCCLLYYYLFTLYWKIIFFVQILAIHKNYLFLAHLNQHIVADCLWNFNTWQEKKPTKTEQSIYT